MSSLAIPAASPPPSSNPEAGSPPTAGGLRFDDALQKSQPAGQTPSGGQAADGKPGMPTHDNPRGKASSNARDDKHTRNDPSPQPAVAPATMIAPPTVRQPVADNGDQPPAAGKNTPADAGTTATTSIAAAMPTLTSFASLAAPPTAAATPRASAAAIASLPSTPPAPPLPAANASSDNATAIPTQLPETGVAVQTATDDKNENAVAATGIGNLGLHLGQLAGTHAAPTITQPPPPTQLSMQATPGQPQFAQETAQHVAWLVGQDIQRAEIQINPRKLGPIQVEITTHKDRVDVSFAVQHPQTVHALQQTLPQLHDMLAQQGLNLGNATVGQQARGQQHPRPGHPSGGNAIGAKSTSRPAFQRLRIATPGRVDDFA